MLALKTGGEAHEKAMEKVHRNLKLLEEGMRGCFPGGFPSIAGESDNMGLLDIVMCSIFGPHEAYEEFFGVKIIDQERYPLLSFWLKSLAELPLVKELSPPHKKLVSFLRYIRRSALMSSAA